MARTPAKSLTDRQRKILEVLESFQKNAGYPPSIRDIGAEAGISSTSVVNYYLIQLKKLGYIERDEKVSRGIRLIKRVDEILAESGDAVKRTADKVGQTIEQMLHIPVLGQIVASAPMPVPSSDFNYFDPEMMIDVASSLLPARDTQDLFALRVKGDSMIDAMVHDGDLVVMKRVEEANNGEMVAVWLTDRDETTLKYFYKEGSRLRLQPANSTMAPIYIDDPKCARIQGKVVLVIRQGGGRAS
jgi:repressor LexA